MAEEDKDTQQDDSQDSGSGADTGQSSDKAEHKGKLFTESEVNSRIEGAIKRRFKNQGEWTADKWEQFQEMQANQAKTEEDRLRKEGEFDKLTKAKET